MRATDARKVAPSACAANSDHTTLSVADGRVLSIAPMLRPRLRFAIFAAPFHATDANPSLSFQRDRELVQWLEELGYDEAWIGEHHSAGYETIASPELFIADVAARTHRIKLGTGVVSLPYHNPLMVADRMVQ